MKRLTCLTFGMLLACTLGSCQPATPVLPTASLPEPAGEVAAIEGTQAPSDYPLSEPGPYYVGKLRLDLEDASRENRPVGLRVWYPAVPPEGAPGPQRAAGDNRDPDRTGAPYPLIVSSAIMGADLAPYLVTHGFVWAGVTGIDTWDLYDAQIIEQPLDILFALDQVATNPPEVLEGMIDAEHAGAIGYSFDGYNTLAMSGARIDPEFYLAQCANADATAEAVLAVLPNRYQCALAGEWEDFAAHAGDGLTKSENGLWQPMTDERIRAVMPLASEGWLLFGEKGLAAADRPTLILVATEDIWYPENALIFDHLGTRDKALISFVGEDHMMVFDGTMRARMAHFATAFFGYHLQGREDLASYFSEEFVNQHDDLTWGVYEGEQ
jgi:predicted dienelactone hydrolase